MNNKTWFVVAHRGGAKIFEMRGENRNLEKVREFTNDLAFEDSRQLRNDAMGRVFSPDSSYRHSVESSESINEQILRQFAQRLSHELYQARNRDQVSRLVLIAAPALLGQLRTELDRVTQSVVIQSIDRDWASLNNQDIKQRLSDLTAQVRDQLRFGEKTVGQKG